MGACSRRNGVTARSVGAAIPRPVAGKTGTTDSNRAAWFVGFTPNLAGAAFYVDPDAPSTSSVPNTNVPISVFALAGIVLLAAAPNLPLALAGFGIAGLGASVGFPLAVTAAADLDPARASTAVATLSFIALCGFLVGPPLIGLVGEHVDLRAGLAALLPLLVASLALSGRLGRTIPLTSLAGGKA